MMQSAVYIAMMSSFRRNRKAAECHWPMPMPSASASMIIGIRIAAILVILGGIGAARAAPNIPPSEMPGRERFRFQETPADRFMAVPRQNGPLIQWDCDHRKPAHRGGKRTKRDKRC
jgi:hypothetical protein